MATKQKTKRAIPAAAQVPVEIETQKPLVMDREILKQCSLVNGMSQEQIEKEYLRVAALLGK